MRIGTLARKTGVSPRLLRYYEEQGLLHPRRDSNGYRTYTDADVVSVRHIRNLLAAGLPTAAIGGLIDCIHDDGDQPTPPMCPTMLHQLKRQYARTSEAIERLHQSQELIVSMLNAEPAAADR